MPLRLRRGTNAQRLTITPAEGELIYTTDLKEIFVGDGSTVGGNILSNGGGNGGALGQNLDLSNFDIVGTGNIDITGTISNGDILITNNVITSNNTYIAPGSGNSIGILEFGSSSDNVKIKKYWDESNENLEENFGITNGVFSLNKTSFASRGTLNSPSVVVPGDTLTKDDVFGHDGTGYVLTSSIWRGIDPAVTPGDVHGAIGFITYSGVNFKVLQFDSQGRLAINKFPLPATEALDVNGNAVISGQVTAAAFKGTFVGDDSSLIIDGINSNIYCEKLNFPDNSSQTTAFRNLTLTNRFYVDATQTNDYVSDGSYLKPFKTLTDALSYVESLIDDNIITPTENDPAFIVLCSTVNENVTLTVGHVLLTSLFGSSLTPIYINGTVTVNGSDTSGDSNKNHFVINAVSINAPPNKACIHFTGTNAQTLEINDSWLLASGNQTGTTLFVDSGGFCIYSDNTGIDINTNLRSNINGSNLILSNTGSGDTYCLKIVNSTAYFNNLAPVRASQIAAVQDFGILSITNSLLTGTGDVLVECYSGGILYIYNCQLQTAALDKNGLNLFSGSTTTIINCTFNILESNPGVSSRVIYSNSSSLVLFYHNLSFAFGSNNRISTIIGASANPLPSTLVPA